MLCNQVPFLSLALIVSIAWLTFSKTAAAQHLGENVVDDDASETGNKRLPLSTARQLSLLITGNFSLDGELVNIASYNFESDTWTKKFQADLIYVDSNGVILDVVVNKSQTLNYDKVYVVGLFDTITRTSQVQFCSVGSWSGLGFEKVGEGLCPRGTDPSSVTRISTAIISRTGDLFVGGSFEARVWDGHHFVNIFYAAVFDGDSGSWMPLSGGQLKLVNSDQKARVNALAWDSINDRLFIGGSFNAIDNNTISNSLAVWSPKSGLISFPTEGVVLDINAADAGVSSGVVQNMAFEARSSSLFVSGDFLKIGDILCQTVAVWHSRSNSWTCLYDPLRGLSTVTAMVLEGSVLYLAGYVAPSSIWRGRDWQAPYTIAKLDITGYIVDCAFKASSRTMPSSLINDSIVFDTFSKNSNNSNSNDRRPNFVKRKLRNAGFGPNRIKQHHNLEQMDLAENKNRPSFVSISSSTVIPFKQPSARPSLPLPWKMEWHWLEGYSGGNGPIVRIIPFEEISSRCLYIAGAYNNYQALVKWCMNFAGGPTTTLPVSPRHSIEGFVTNAVLVYLQESEEPDNSGEDGPVVSPSIIISIDTSGRQIAAIISVIVLIGALIGTLLIRYRSNGYAKLRSNEDYEFDGSGELAAHLHRKGMHNVDNFGYGGMTVSLTTLAGSNDSIDIRACFDQAMKARHLPSHESLLIINPKEVVLSKIIGEGSFGRVWSGYWKNNAVAIKEFVFAQAAIVGGSVERVSIIEEIIGEAGIMTCLRHPKILQLYGCCLTMQAIWIVNELCNKGSLRMLLDDRNEYLSDVQKLSLCLDIADGMVYLHSRNPPIIHRDIKSHNIFVIETAPGKFVAKIGDWGSARAIALSGSKSMTQGVGTACWLAPEVIYNAHFSMDSDIYAFGIVLWEVESRQEVHSGLSAAQIIAKVAHEGLRPPLPSASYWAELISSCWTQVPRDRPTFHQINATLSTLYSSAVAAETNADPEFKDT